MAFEFIEGRAHVRRQHLAAELHRHLQGYAPQVAVEFGRKVLYSNVRPTFNELESHVKGKK